MKSVILLKKKICQCPLKILKNVNIPRTSKNIKITLKKTKMSLQIRNKKEQKLRKKLKQ
jgi:hypothetical protein